MADLVIRGGTVYDGTGAPPYEADVAITGERISAVGTALEGRHVIDARGAAVAPGFIDVHSHDDLAVFLTPEMDFKLMQGVTTDVVGNCGMGAAPYVAARRFLPIFGTGAASIPEWEGYSGYMNAIDRAPPSLNVAVLAGHGTLRLAAMGTDARPPRRAEMAAMRSWLREGLDGGIVGMSTGLIYEPGRHAATDEITALAREMSGCGAVYATHMRNEADALLDAVQEALQTGRDADVPVQISHHKASGRANWGRVHESLALLEAARADGKDVTADQYPYTAGSTVLSAVLASGALEGGGAIGQIEPPAIRIASAPNRSHWEGHTLARLAVMFGAPPRDAALRIVEEEPAAVVVVESMDEEDVRTVLRHSTTMIGSDGIPAGSKPHPRLYGTFARVLGTYVRDLGLLTIEEAIHKMTGMPAAKFALAGRGVIREAAAADIVVFDPREVRDTATYDHPQRHPSGIHSVIVNGCIVVRDGRHTGERPGRALRRGLP